MTERTDIERHDRDVRALTIAVANLLPKFGPAGVTPEAIFEGAVRGGGVALLSATPASPDDVANLLDAIASSFRDLGRPQLRVVHKAED